MFRLFGLFTILLVVGVAQCHVVRRDIQQDANNALTDVKAKIEEFNKLVKTVEARIDNIVKTVTDLTEPAVEQFGQALLNSTNSLERNIKRLTNIDIAKDTCGIISINEYAQYAYDIARRCTDDMVEKIVSGLRAISGNTAILTKEFENIQQKLENCRYLDGSDDLKKSCLEEAKNEASRLVQKFSEAVRSLTPKDALVQVPALLRSCLTSDGTKLLLNKVDSVVECLNENVPGFKAISDEVKKVSEYFKKTVIVNVENFASIVINEFKKVELKVREITNEIAHALNIIKENITVLIVKVKHELELLAQKVLKSICRYCSCRICTFCPCEYF